MTARASNAVAVKCLSCRHKGVISERQARFGVTPGAPISYFVKLALPQMRQPKRDG